ncbi:hypothetical protein HAX54_032006 [Datura stramonium]|uniref:Uncharacterized protein n=1 Tax=Datura stramonium TaxID=4076 RepID=A0ABS8VCX1_DATST|nr:hypothetical protein [Datura stramonium]
MSIWYSSAQELGLSRYIGGYYGGGNYYVGCTGLQAYLSKLLTYLSDHLAFIAKFSKFSQVKKKIPPNVVVPQRGSIEARGDVEVEGPDPPGADLDGVSPGASMA